MFELINVWMNYEIMLIQICFIDYLLLICEPLIALSSVLSQFLTSYTKKKKKQFCWNILHKKFSSTLIYFLFFTFFESLVHFYIL